MSSTMACTAQPCGVLASFSCSDQVSGTVRENATIFFSTASLWSIALRGAPDRVAAFAVSSLMSSWPCSAISSTLLVVSNWL